MGCHLWSQILWSPPKTPGQVLRWSRNIPNRGQCERVHTGYSPPDVTLSIKRFFVTTTPKWSQLSQYTFINGTYIGRKKNQRDSFLVPSNSHYYSYYSSISCLSNLFTIPHKIWVRITIFQVTQVTILYLPEMLLHYFWDISAFLLTQAFKAFESHALLNVDI